MATITVLGMFLTGDHASRPAASAVGGGSLYSCTDHSLVYQSDASTWTTWLTAGTTVSAGSNSTRVRELSTAGSSTTLWSPFDHAHDGIGTITASSSNTLQRGTFNLRTGNNISFGLTDSDGDGEFDTMTIHGAAAGGGSGSLTVADEGTPLSTAATTLDFVGAGVVASGTGATKTITIAGGGGTVPEGLIVADTIPGSPGAEDEEWEGTADTLPTDWSWVSVAPTFSINSDYPSMLVIERADTTERKLRKANFTMAATSGLWIKFSLAQKATTSSQFEFIVYDSGSSNGYGFGVHNSTVLLARDSNAGVLSNRGTFDVGAGGRNEWYYMGMMRNGSDGWVTFFSQNGINWTCLQTADTRAFTADRLELRWSADEGNTAINGHGSRGTVDWIRYRTDNLFPRP